MKEIIAFLLEPENDSILILITLAVGLLSLWFIFIPFMQRRHNKM